MLNIFSFLVGVLLGIAYLTLSERGVLGLSQNRVSPNKVGLGGLLQPILDGLKLLLTQGLQVSKEEGLLFWVLPLWSLWLVLMSFWAYPSSWISWAWTLILILILWGLNVLVLMMLTLKSKSKYASLGALRGAAGGLAFDFSALVVVLILFKITQALELSGVVSILTNFLWGMVVALLSLQEVGRTPFDLPEGESELVSGFNTELSAAYFTLVFLSEYGGLIFMGHFSALVVMGGHPLGAVIYVVGLLYARSVLPRARVEKALGLSLSSLGLILLGALMALVSISVYSFGSKG